MFYGGNGIGEPGMKREQLINEQTIQKKYLFFLKEVIYENSNT